MKCSECCYQEISPEYPNGRCIWEIRAPGDMPPCDEEDTIEENDYEED